MIIILSSFVGSIAHSTERNLLTNPSILQHCILPNVYALQMCKHQLPIQELTFIRYMRPATSIKKASIANSTLFKRRISALNKNISLFFLNKRIQHFNKIIELKNV